MAVAEYEFKCVKCGCRMEVRYLKMADLDSYARTVRCPECKSKMRQVIFSVPSVLKGAGWTTQPAYFPKDRSN